MVHGDNKRIIDGLRRREMKCIGPRAKDADLWIWILGRSAQSFHEERILLEDEHVALRRNTAHVAIRIIHH